MIKKSFICLTIIITISFLIGGCSSDRSGKTVILEADLSQTSGKNKASILEDAKEKISLRLITYGVDGTTVKQESESRLRVDLPSDADIEAIKVLLTTTGFLEFREVEKNNAGEIVTLNDYLEADVNYFFDKEETSNRIFVGEQDEKGYSHSVAIIIRGKSGLLFLDINGNPIDKSNLVQYSDSPSWISSRGDDGTQLTGDMLADAQLGTSDNFLGAQPEVNINWNAEGTVIFDQIAASLYDPECDFGGYNLKYVMGIFFDNVLISAPKVMSSSYQGKAVISGNFTTESAAELAVILKSGSLPVSVSVVE